jgi:DNA primase small subunit
MELSERSRQYVRSKFAAYYGMPHAVVAPPQLETREFGFLIFDGKSMLRHMGFKSGEDLGVFLARSVPSDAYFSCAHYEQPEAEMNEKGWVGADLIFDIDADHIPTSCGKIHDEWTCGTCGFVGKGPTPDNCPVCTGQKFDVKMWPCEACLDSAKAETTKLLDMLTEDFGFHERELSIFFSGHRGYHVHVDNEDVKSVDAVARKEIVDYVCGLGVDLSLYGLHEEGRVAQPFSRGPSSVQYGWQRRLARNMHDFILNAEPEDYKRIRLRGSVIEALMKNREKILQSWGDSQRLGFIRGMGAESRRKIAEFCMDSVFAKVDTVVTTDIHRLIRLADSLHSKTGFKKVGFPISDIDRFDPFKEAIAFRKGETSVFVSDSPSFRLGDDTFGPYRNQKVRLPTAAAVFLICKNRAEVLE